MPKAFAVKRNEMAGWTGLEPAASAVTGQRSNQLYYHPFWGFQISDFGSRIEGLSLHFNRITIVNPFAAP